jgi:hypothetical protein
MLLAEAVPLATGVAYDAIHWAPPASYGEQEALDTFPLLLTNA